MLGDSNFKLSPNIDLNQEVEGLNEGISTPPDPALTRNEEDSVREPLESMEQLHLHSPKTRYFGKARYRRNTF